MPSEREQSDENLVVKRENESDGKIDGAMKKRKTVRQGKQKDIGSLLGSFT